MALAARFVRYVHAALCPLPSAPALARPALCVLCRVLGACDVTIKDGDITNVSAPGAGHRGVEPPVSARAGGRVEIVNDNGSIEVVAGAAGVGRGGGGDRGAGDDRRARAKEILSERRRSRRRSPPITCASRPSRGRAAVALEIELQGDGAGRRAARDDAATTATSRPTGLRGHVKAMVVNGGIELTAMRGTVDAAAVNGPRVGEDGGGHRTRAARKHERSDLARSSERPRRRR